MQNHAAVPFWSEVIGAERPAVIIELGTWEGGFTCLLGIAARNYGLQLHSFGHDEINPRSVPWFAHLAGTLTFHRCDVFAEDTLRTFKALYTGGKVLALCDNGSKPREFALLAPMLRPGDIIACHDIGGEYWDCCEMTEADIAAPCATYGLEPYMPDQAYRAGWLAKRKA